jgi:hypothetical protein
MSAATTASETREGATWRTVAIISAAALGCYLAYRFWSNRAACSDTVADDAESCGSCPTSAEQETPAEPAVGPFT